jgi:hypothetical protein
VKGCTKRSEGFYILKFDAKIFCFIDCARKQNIHSALEMWITDLYQITVIALKWRLMKGIQKAECSGLNTSRGERNVKLAPKQEKNVKMLQLIQGIMLAGMR